MKGDAQLDLSWFDLASFPYFNYLMAKSNPSRLYWGQQNIKLPPLDLIGTQRESYRWLLKEGIADVLEEISPVDDFTGKNWSLSFGKHLLDSPKCTVEEAKFKGLTHEAPLKAEATLLNKQSGEMISSEVFLGDLPLMTSRGTFIVNGVERCVVNQLVRSPGAYFSGEVDPKTGKMFFKAELRPLRGAWLEFEVGKKDVVNVRINRRRKFPATVFFASDGPFSRQRSSRSLS